MHTLHAFFCPSYKTGHIRFNLYKYYLIYNNRLIMMLAYTKYYSYSVIMAPIIIVNFLDKTIK